MEKNGIRKLGPFLEADAAAAMEDFESGSPVGGMEPDVNQPAAHFLMGDFLADVKM